MTARRFAFSFDPSSRRLLRLGGITPATCEVVVDDERLRVRYGRFRVDTPLENVREVRITRDYRWFKAIGPRGSLADRGVTFGTNARAGVCICFHTSITALLGRLFPHPNLTVTVEDVAGLAATLQATIDRRSSTG